MLRLENINVAVEGDKQILRDVNLEIPKNSLTVITGQNGSGKTSLAKVLMGIMQPQQGKIYWDGQDITELAIEKRAALGIGMAFQLPVKFKGFKVREILGIAAGRRLSGDKLVQVLERVGLPATDYIERNLDGDLSGGEIKRIEIAMLLARNSDLMIFDEPEAGIDLWSFENLMRTFWQLKGEHTIIIVSHQKQILELADNIVVMKRGRVEAYGKRDEMLERLCLKK
ncbi:MAG: ATP-binding cassette domain-containing protein [Candidatus Saccharimonadales bacterium]